MVDIGKILLSQIDLYYGKISMPKGYEIDRVELKDIIIKHLLQDCPFPFSIEWDKLNTFLTDHIRVEHNLQLISKLTHGYMFNPNETSQPQLDIEPVDLRNSPDYTMLYGVDVKNCHIKIFYDQNRRKNRTWDIPLENNEFIMFPSTQNYIIINKTDKINIVLKQTYEFI